MKRGGVKWSNCVGIILILLLTSCAEKQYAPMLPHAKVYGVEKNRHSDGLSEIKQVKQAKSKQYRHGMSLDTEPETIVRDISFNEKLYELFPERVSNIKRVVQQSAFTIKNIQTEHLESSLSVNDVSFHLLANVDFPSGKFVLSDEERKVFSDLALALQQGAVRTVMVVGHSDSSGNTQANRRLSVQRAKAVANVFVKSGYSRSHIFFQGVGEYEPIQSNKTKQGRAENRRIEIIEATDFAHVAQVRLQAIRQSKAPKGVLSATMLLKNMRGQFYALPLFSTSFSASVKGSAFVGEQLLKYGVDTGVEKKKKSFLSAFSSFFEAHADEDKKTKYARIPNILGDSIKPSLTRADLADAKFMSVSKWQLGYEANVAPLAVMLDRGAHLDISAFPISRDGTKLMVKTSPLKLYTSQKSITPRVILKGYDKLYSNENTWLYRWKSSQKSLGKYGLIGLDILLKSFKDEDFQQTHIERFPALLYYVAQGKIMVASVYVHKRLFKKEKITINYLKSFLPI